MADIDQFRLTPDEERSLREQESRVRMLDDVLKRLDSIGVDVAAERDMLERAKKIRAGMLRQFGRRGSAV